MTDPRAIAPPSRAEPSAVLELRGIGKHFGSTTALDGVDFVLRRGEIHALLGENGAGKSTLMRIAYGMLPADRGTISVGGQTVRIRSPKDARRHGIGMVHQHFTSAPTMSVEENIWLAAGRYRGWRPATPHAGSVVAELEADLDPKARVESLTVAQQQRLEILKALIGDATILLLDEPTAVLAPSEVEGLLAILRTFVANGGAAVLITHKLAEVVAAADRVTVLRRGHVSFDGPFVGQTKASLADAMIGPGEGARAIALETRAAEPHAVASGAVLVRGLGFAVREGELVGIAAIEGNGQRELLRAVARVDDHPGIVVDVTGPVAFVPEDRITEGLVASMSLTENLVLGLLDDPRWQRGWWIRWAAARDRMGELIQEFGIRAAGPGVAARTLSGGNQQKVVLARALEGSPRVLIAENPTRGLDLRATAEVHERLRATAAAGAAVLVYSTDLDEVLSLSDRVLVVHRSKVTEAPPGATRAVVGELMLGLAHGH